jgi:hypothetical protein
MLVRTLVIALGSLMTIPMSSNAMCTDNRHPSVAKEYESSKLIMIGRVEHENVVVSPDDPEGVDAYLYQIRPIQVFKGSAQRRINIRSDAGSSSFPMEIGKEYVLFLSVFPDATIVDSCGNSDLVSKSHDVVTFLKHRSKRK